MENISPSLVQQKHGLHRAPSRSNMTISLIYWLLFLVGFAGNTSILSLMFYLAQKIRRAGAAARNSLRYISALCCVDMLVVLSIPVVVVDLLLGQWPFGTAICKAFLFLESLGKVLSGFILSAMSFQRYCAVRYLQPTHVQSRHCLVGTLAVLGVTAAALLSPLPYYAEEVIVSDVLFDPQTNDTLQVVVSKCMTNHMTPTASIVFTVVIFVSGFIIPTILMLYFSFSVLFELRNRQNTSIARSFIPFRKLTLYTLLICGFYCTCWTPYWLGLLYANSKPAEGQWWFLSVMYVVHALPMLNSCFNWLFYALFNTELRRLKRQSTKNLYKCVPPTLKLQRQSTQRRRRATLHSTTPLTGIPNHMEGSFFEFPVSN